MRSNICALCRLLLFVGFFYHGRLMSTDPTYETDLKSTELPFTPSAASTVFHTVYGGTNGTNDTDIEETDPSESPLELNTILICASPILILLLLLPLIFCIIRHKRRKMFEKDDPPKEDIKSPIFEEDTPSVMEIEMEDLDKWMNNIKKNKHRLSTLEEENKFNTSIES
ncbi:transmembrane protein 154 isoform X2 [Rana temporaria]|uniref:transmembrane protein 154 isoform X2 n=1 Tax=Rana temporaria TaxID=8407 RepID=UPI001AADEDCE|nr:transmembrane protein 154 isoform X2 [Rana temporaria]